MWFSLYCLQLLVFECIERTLLFPQSKCWKKSNLEIKWRHKSSYLICQFIKLCWKSILIFLAGLHIWDCAHLKSTVAFPWVYSHMHSTFLHVSKVKSCVWAGMKVILYHWPYLVTIHIESDVILSKCRLHGWQL